MIKGSTIIMSEEYINELERHKINLEKEYELEDIPDKKEAILKKINTLRSKLDSAIEFQDTVDEIFNLEVPSMTVVKTITGLVIPLANVKVL